MQINKPLIYKYPPRRFTRKETMAGTSSLQPWFPKVGENPPGRALPGFTANRCIRAYETVVIDDADALV
jgi:hypothetical protein